MSLTFTFDAAVPPLIPSNVDFTSAYVEFFQIGRVQASTVEANLFTDGVAIWTGGEIIDMSKISGLLLPTDPTDAASKAYVDASVGGNPGGNNATVQFNDGGVFGGDDQFTWNQTTNVLTVTGTVTGLATPTASSDAANKAYVDAASGNPGGFGNNIQFNTGGVSPTFGGSNDFTWDNTLKQMDVTGSVSATNLVGTSINGTTVTGDTLTDGFITITGGAMSGITTVTGTTISDGAGTTITGGVVTADTFTDNFATLTGGALTDITDITFMDDNVTPTTINMGDNAGSTDGLGLITGLKTLTGLSGPFDAANKAYVDAAIGTSPGGFPTYVQFNDAGIFNGSANFAWDKLTSVLTVTGTITDTVASLVGGALSGVTTIGASGIVTLTNATASTLTTNGALVVTGGVGIGGDSNIAGQVFATDFNATSDIRLKENIIPLEGSLDKLADIGCYSYNLIGSDRTAYGVLAQQLEEVGFKDIVRDTPHHKTVNYMQFIALLIDGMNELRDEVTELKKFKTSTLQGSLHETFAPTKTVTNNFKTVRAGRKTNIMPGDRKKYEGLTYKYCFECSQWTVLDNFARDSSEGDCYKKKCKKH